MCVDLTSIHARSHPIGTHGQGTEDIAPVASAVSMQRNNFALGINAKLERRTWKQGGAQRTLGSAKIFSRDRWRRRRPDLRGAAYVGVLGPLGSSVSCAQEHRGQPVGCAERPAPYPLRNTRHIVAATRLGHCLGPGSSTSGLITKAAACKARSSRYLLSRHAQQILA